MEGRVGVPVEKLVQLSRQRNAKVKTPYLDLWIAILDELISWQISLLTVFYAERKTKRPRVFDRAITVLLMKILSDSMALRHLVLLGYDVAARSLLRSIGEYIELFVAILDDPKLANHFDKSDTPEGAKWFWRTHIARGALGKRVAQAWGKWFQAREPETANWLASWGRQSNSKLSAMIHPSFAGGLFSAIPFKTEHTDEKWLGIWGDKSDGSVDTIYIYASYMFSMLLLHHEFPFERIGEGFPRPIRFEEETEFHKHVKEGRFILASLILSLGKQSNRAYIFPEYDLTIFKKRKRRKRVTDRSK